MDANHQSDKILLVLPVTADESLSVLTRVDVGMYELRHQREVPEENSCAHLENHHGVKSVGVRFNSQGLCASIFLYLP